MKSEEKKTARLNIAVLLIAVAMLLFVLKMGASNEPELLLHDHYNSHFQKR